MNAKGTKIKVTLVAKELIQTLPLELKLKIAPNVLPALRLNKTSNIQELIAIYHNNRNEFLTIHHTAELRKAFGMFFKSSTTNWIESFTAHVKQRAMELLQNDNQQHLSTEEKLLLESWRILLEHCKLFSGQ